MLITHLLLDRVFLQGLQLFPHIRIYANAYVLFTINHLTTLTHSLLSINDMTVPYMTAFVDPEDPFLNYTTNGLTVYATVRSSSHIFADSPFSDYDEKYFPIIKSFTIPDTPPPKPQSARPFTWMWFKSYKAPLPPRFQSSTFPFNIVRAHPYILNDTSIHAGFLIDATLSPPTPLP